jgi:hypothetical protein
MPDTPAPDPQSQTPGQVLAGSPPAQAPPQQVPPPQVQDAPLNSRQGPGLAPPSGFPQQPPPPTPQQLKAAAVDQHHRTLGKVTSFLFGTEVDPATGQKIPEKPGTILRSLLAGALLGASAGLKEGHGIIGGIAAGGAAGMGLRDQQEQQRQEQSEKRQKMSQEQQAAADEHILHQASAAHMMAETVNFHTLQAWHDKEALDKKNAAARVMMKTYEEAGARPAQIPVYGKVPENGLYNARELSAAITKDPSILFGSPGVTRHFVDLHDASDVEFIAGKGWVNADTGEPAGMTEKTTVKVFDLPESLSKVRIQHTGTEVNTLATFPLVPKDQEDHLFSATADDWTKLNTNGLKNLNAKALAAQRDAAAAAALAKAHNAGKPKTGTPAQFRAVEKDKATALAKAETAYQKSEKPEAEALDDLNRAKAAAQKSYEDQVKDLGGSITPGGKPAQPGGQGVVNVTDPKGVVHSFTDQKSADAFKKAVGIQ